MPLFSGCVFLSPHAGRGNWRAVHSLRGFSRIVSFGADGPARVPRGLVETLRLRCGPGDVVDWTDSLRPGQEVALRNGPFADLLARIECLAPDERAVVLVDLMGRKVRTTVDRRDLALASPAAWAPGSCGRPA